MVLLDVNVYKALGCDSAIIASFAIPSKRNKDESQVVLIGMDYSHQLYMDLLDVNIYKALGCDGAIIASSTIPAKRNKNETREMKLTTKTTLKKSKQET